MDLQQILLDVLTQVPALAVLAFIVQRFLDYAKKGSDDFRGYLESRDNLHKVELESMRDILMDISRRINGKH